MKVFGWVLTVLFGGLIVYEVANWVLGWVSGDYPANGGEWTDLVFIALFSAIWAIPLGIGVLLVRRHAGPDPGERHGVSRSNAFWIGVYVVVGVALAVLRFSA